MQSHASGTYNSRRSSDIGLASRGVAEDIDGLWVTQGSTDNIADTGWIEDSLTNSDLQDLLASILFFTYHVNFIFVIYLLFTLMNL